MDRKKIKKILAGLSIAGLVSGLAASSQAEQSGSADMGSSCGSGNANTQQEAVTSCGKGSKTGTDMEQQSSDNSNNTSDKDTQESSSCGKGSCGN